MVYLEKLIDKGNQDLVGLEEEGFIFRESRKRYGPRDNCEEHVKRELVKRIPSLKGIQTDTLMQRINSMVFRFNTLEPYNRLPVIRDPKDFIVMYTNFDINRMSEYIYDDTLPINFIPGISHWAKVVGIHKRSGSIKVTSKMVFADVYEHEVSNKFLLDLFCGGRFYYFIDILELEKLFANES